MDVPHLIRQNSFQSAWKEAVAFLATKNWDYHNLVVQIDNPTIIDQNIHTAVTQFCGTNGVLKPKDVAYTIFPHKLYATYSNKADLFEAYNRKGGLFDRTRRRPKHGWGTYFNRMTAYSTHRGPVNQLDLIINAIRSRRNRCRAAYTILIPQPGGETARKMGAPCLNYLAVQCKNRALGILAIYRNHDFLERAYGNYWGLCNLTKFLAAETSSTPGTVTCISSHAYAQKHRRALSNFAGTL